MLPRTSEVVDVVCEIARREDLGAEFGSQDLPANLFALPEGLRLVDCLHPADARINPRLAADLESDDPALRLWAAYVLSRRLPLDDRTLLHLASYLDDALPDPRERVRWSFRAQGSLSAGVAAAVRTHDPALANELQVDIMRLSAR